MHTAEKMASVSNVRFIRWPMLGLIVGLLTAWGLLASAAQQPAPRVGRSDGKAQAMASFLRFPDWVAGVAFSPDGRMLAAGSYGVTKLLDAAEYKELATLNEPSGFVRSVAFSRDGKQLYCGSYQAISVWDVAERKSVRTLKGHRGYVTSLAISPDGKLLASASDDESVRLWDAETGELRQPIAGLGQPALSVAFSPDGQSLAVATGDPTRPTKKGSVRVFDLTGQMKFVTDAHDRAVAAVAYSPDGALLASGSADETVRLWDAGDGKEVRVLEGHSRPVNGLAFVPGGWLVSCSGGRNAGKNEIKIWELATGADRVTIPAHEAPVQQVAVSADGAKLASGSYDKSVKLWDLAATIAALTAPQPAATTLPATEAAVTEAKAAAEPAVKMLRVGMIGLDTSHCVAFTQILNDSGAKEDVAGCRVVAAYPKGSPDIASSVSRVPEYTQKLKELEVEIVDSIDDLVQKVDVVLLETNDGRPHLEQALPVLKAGKAVFIDKPIAGSLADAVAIFEAARKYKAPVFSSSSLRYTDGAQAIRGGKIGEVKGCDAYSPCELEATHPDLFWYGIHGVESLFTVMGPGCESVSRVSTPGIDVATGVWKGGRVGSFRGVRSSQGGGAASYGGTAFGTKGIEQIGPYGGYRPLVVEIVKFFRTGQPPVAEEETLEIYAFMEAADESKRQGGKPVTLESVLEKARAAARAE